METIYMILAVAVLIVAIAVAFEWGYYKGMRDEIIQVKKAERCETKIGDSSTSPAKSYRSAKNSKEVLTPKVVLRSKILNEPFPKGKQKKSPREEAEKARYDAILANIDNYTGDSKGQKEVISGGKEIL